MGLAGGQEILRRVRPRPLTLVGGLLGAVYAGGAVCPEQGLMLLGLAAFVAFMGLMGEGPQSGAEAAKEARTGNSYALVGLMMWKVGPIALWFAALGLPVALGRLVASGPC